MLHKNVALLFLGFRLLFLFDRTPYCVCSMHKQLNSNQLNATWSIVKKAFFKLDFINKKNL